MTDLKKLRELAGRATKNIDHFGIEDTFPTLWFVDKKGEEQDITNDDLIFWEKANPETVIALLDRIEKLDSALSDAIVSLKQLKHSGLITEKAWDAVTDSIEKLFVLRRGEP